MGFERIRVLRHLFGGLGDQYSGIEDSRSLQAEVELRAMLSALHEHEMSDQRLADLSYAVIDTETTGFSPQDDVLLSVAAVLLGQVPEDSPGFPEFYSFVRIPKDREVPELVSDLTGIYKEHVLQAPKVDEVLQMFLQYIGDRILIGHHVGHDIRFLNAALRKNWGIELHSQVLDTGKIAMCLHQMKKYPSLDMLLSLYEISVNERHTALGDAKMTAAVIERQLALLQEHGIYTLGKLWEMLLVLEHSQQRS